MPISMNDNANVCIQQNTMLKHHLNNYITLKLKAIKTLSSSDFIRIHLQSISEWEYNWLHVQHNVM